MNPSISRHLARIALVLLVSAAPAAADPSPAGSRWAAGLAVISSPNPYADHDTEVLPVPLVLYDGPKFYSSGTGVGLRLFESGRLTVGLLGSFRFEGFDPERSAFLDGVAERKGALELGPEVSLELGRGALHLGALGDVTDTHGGQEVAASYRLSLPVGRFEIVPVVGVIWKSAALADYYFGVRPHEAAPGRPAFETGDAFNVRTGLDAVFPLSPRWLLTIGTEYERLSRSLVDSPIVTAGHQISGHVAVLRRF